MYYTLVHVQEVTERNPSFHELTSYTGRPLLQAYQTCFESTDVEQTLGLSMMAIDTSGTA